MSGLSGRPRTTKDPWIIAPAELPKITPPRERTALNSACVRVPKYAVRAHCLRYLPLGRRQSRIQGGLRRRPSRQWPDHECGALAHHRCGATSSDTLRTGLHSLRLRGQSGFRMTFWSPKRISEGPVANTTISARRPPAISTKRRTIGSVAPSAIDNECTGGRAG